MTDQIPADKVREIVNEMNLSMKEPAEGSFSEGYDDATGNWKRHLEALLPPPPRPTLADMTPQERAACRRMQADVEGRSERYVIAAPYEGDADVALIGPDWEFDWIEPECVTPRPDLPRMAWPGDTPNTGPGHLAVGTVIESAADHRIAALPVGSILLGRDEEATIKRPWGWTGLGYHPIPSEGDRFGPWTVRRIGREADQ